MRPFEVDDISPIDMKRVQQLTADFMQAENCGRPGAQQELAQGLHYVLKPYNTFSSSLLLKRVEATIGCHVCAFFHECSRKCRYQHGGYSWNHEKLAWKPLELKEPCLRRVGRDHCFDTEEDFCPPATGGPYGVSEQTSPREVIDAGPSRRPSREALQLMAVAPGQPFTQIPVVDFGEFLHGSSSQQREVAAQIGDACRNVGFMYLVNHGVSQSLINDVMSVSKEFFDLPTETKRKYGYANGGFRGYFGVRAEDLDQFGESKNGKKGDLKEGFDAGLEKGRLPLGRKPSPTFHAPNRWPTEEMPELEVVMNRYLDTVRALAERLTEAFALSLGLPREYFKQKVNAPCINLRVNHYPARPEDGEGIGCGAHSDYGLFTILAQDLVGGLQVRNSVGDWVDATPLEGSFVINIGDMMQRWTNNIYSSTIHRVVDCTGGQSERFSIPFFYNANCDTVVECLPTCTSEDRPPLFGPDTAENILQNRYNQAFNGKK